MKKAKVTVPWTSGLHMRPAAQLVKLAQRFHSQIRLQMNSRIADARSILSIMMLSAGLGTALNIEATGADEREAIEAVREFFGGDDASPDQASVDATVQENTGLNSPSR